MGVSVKAGLCIVYFTYEQDVLEVSNSCLSLLRPKSTNHILICNSGLCECLKICGDCRPEHSSFNSRELGKCLV